MAIKLKITFNKTSGADVLLGARINNARQLIAKQITEGAAEFVKTLIPDKGGWYKIYLEALVYFSSKDGNLWAASGLWPKEYSEYPADTTLIEFTPRPGNKIEEALTSYNPWTVDQLPSLTGGIQAEAKAKVASTNEVTAQRDRLVAAAKAIKELLLGAGATYATAVPKIQGKVYADVAWMATALEHGLAGLPRIPHWVKALRLVQNGAESLVEPAKDQIQRVLNGEEEFSEEGDEMPPDLAKKIGL